jgi:hypothetical protein
VTQGFDIWVADATAPDEMRFVMPVVPVGIYDVEVLWGPGFGSVGVVDNLIDAVFRNRSIPTYRIRRRMPDPPYKAARPILPRNDEAP